MKIKVAALFTIFYYFVLDALTYTSCILTALHVQLQFSHVSFIKKCCIWSEYIVNTCVFYTTLYRLQHFHSCWWSDSLLLSQLLLIHLKDLLGLKTSYRFTRWTVNAAQSEWIYLSALRCFTAQVVLDHMSLLWSSARFHFEHWSFRSTNFIVLLDRNINQMLNHLKLREAANSLVGTDFI